VSWLARHRLHLALFALGFAVYGLVSGSRLFHQSSDPHFVYQADAWLHGKIAIDPRPAKGDDWAKVETVTVDGEPVRGRVLHTRAVFRTVGGDEIPLARVRRAHPPDLTYYVSFPATPTLLMMPGALLGGRNANDVFPTVLLAALCLPLLLLCLERLNDAGLAERSRADQVWLVVLLAFGTVMFFSSVQGKVWYTAHVVGVALALLYAWASIEARHPLVAGIALGLGTLARTPLAFMFPLFAFEAWRATGGLAAWREDRRAFARAAVRRALPFAIPIVCVAIAAAAYNAARFGSPGEFGHSYLDVMQQDQMERYGLMHYHYLSRNLAVALALLPDLSTHAPYVRISGHGLALWVTTPAFLLLLWPARTNRLHRALWVTTALVAIPSLLYQNTGWVQFGYRFSLDYTAFLVLLLAVGGRRLGRVARGLIVAGVLVNLFGAVTFGRDWQFYRANRQVDYPVVIRN
jgi:hypothetical protein